jgi:hypothetical protein
MNEKQLGEREYTDAIMSIYGANPVASIAGAYKSKEQKQLPENPETETVPTGSLYKETRGLLLAARKNLKLKKTILAYEKRRFKQLQVDLGDSLKKPKGKDKKKEEEELLKIPEDPAKMSIRKWMRDLAKKLLQKIRQAIGNKIKQFLKKRFLKKYRKLSPEKRKRLRDRKKFFDKKKRQFDRFRNRGGFRGAIRRGLGRFATKIIGRRNAARFRLFRQTGGVRGAALRGARRAFFKGVSVVKGIPGTIRSLRGLAGMVSDPILGTAKKGAGEVATKAGRGFLARTARNALVGTLGKGGTKTVLKFVKKFVSPLIKKIPIVGALADFLLNVFVFKESPGKSAFKAIASGLLGFIGAAAGSVVPFAGTFLGGILGGVAGDALGGLLYDAIFGGGSASTSKGETVPAAKDGMKVGAKPQLVLVGEGGEEEWIIPKSKLAWWLGASETALNLLTFGAFPVFSAVRALLSATGAGGSVIPADVPEGSSEGAKPKVDAKKPESISSNFGDTLFGFFKKGIGKLKDSFLGVLDKLKSFLPDLSGLPLEMKVALKGIATMAGGGMVMLVDFLLGGGGAQAATGPSDTLDTDGNLDVPDGVPSQDGLPALPRTGHIAGQKYGAARKGGRKHAGTDFDISGNEKFYSRIGGVVSNIGYDPNGYGNYVDVYNDELKVTERIAEGATVLVKKGQQVQPGTPIVQGETDTGVIHYEIRKGRSTTFGFAGTINPLTFLSTVKPKPKPKPKPKDAAPPSSTPPSRPIRDPGAGAGWRRRKNRTSRNTTPPPVAPLNKKDTASALEEFGTMDEDNNQQVAVIEVPVTRTEYIPMPLPFSTAGRGSVSNTPAWGQGAVLGA